MRTRTCMVEFDDGRKVECEFHKFGTRLVKQDDGLYKEESVAIVELRGVVQMVLPDQVEFIG